MSEDLSVTGRRAGGGRLNFPAAYRSTVWIGGWISHWTDRPFRPIIPFPVRHPPYPHCKCTILKTRPGQAFRPSLQCRKWKGGSQSCLNYLPFPDFLCPLTLPEPCLKDWTKLGLSVVGLGLSSLNSRLFSYSIAG